MKKLLVVLLAVVMLFGLTYSVLAAPTLPEDMWSRPAPIRDACQKLMDYKIIEGKSDGLMWPEAMLTRAELATIITRTSQANWGPTYNSMLINPQRFADVPKLNDDGTPAWWFGYIEVVADAGFMIGTSATYNLFGPSDQTSYAHVYTVLGRMLGYEDANLPSTVGTAWPYNWVVFADRIGLSTVLQPYIGHIENFDPLSPIPREHVFLLVDQALKMNVKTYNTMTNQYIDDISLYGFPITLAQQNGFEALPTPVDKSDLEVLVYKAIDKWIAENGMYTDATWAAFEQALEEACAVLENDNATQQQVNAAYNALDNAMKNLAIKGISGIFGYGAGYDFINAWSMTNYASGAKSIMVDGESYRLPASNAAINALILPLINDGKIRNLFDLNGLWVTIFATDGVVTSIDTEERVVITNDYNLSDLRQNLGSGFVDNGIYTIGAYEYAPVPGLVNLAYINNAKLIGEKEAIKFILTPVDGVMCVRDARWLVDDAFDSGDNLNDYLSIMILSQVINKFGDIRLIPSEGLPFPYEGGEVVLRENNGLVTDYLYQIIRVDANGVARFATLSDLKQGDLVYTYERASGLFDGLDYVIIAYAPKEAKITFAYTDPLDPVLITKLRLETSKEILEVSGSDKWLGNGIFYFNELGGDFEIMTVAAYTALLVDYGPVPVIYNPTTGDIIGFLFGKVSPDVPCPDCGKFPCECPCPDCGEFPCVCDKLCPICGEYPCIGCGNYPCTCCEVCHHDPCECCPVCGHYPCECCPVCGHYPCDCPEPPLPPEPPKPFYALVLNTELVTRQVAVANYGKCTGLSEGYENGKHGCPDCEAGICEDLYHLADGCWGFVSNRHVYSDSADGFCDDPLCAKLNAVCIAFRHGFVQTYDGVCTICGESGPCIGVGVDATHGYKDLTGACSGCGATEIGECTEHAYADLTGACSGCGATEIGECTEHAYADVLGGGCYKCGELTAATCNWHPYDDDGGVCADCGGLATDGIHDDHTFLDTGDGFCDECDGIFEDTCTAHDFDTAAPDGLCDECDGIFEDTCTAHDFDTAAMDGFCDDCGVAYGTDCVFVEGLDTVDHARIETPVDVCGFEGCGLTQAACEAFDHDNADVSGQCSICEVALGSPCVPVLGVDDGCVGHVCTIQAHIDYDFEVVKAGYQRVELLYADNTREWVDLEYSNLWNSASVKGGEKDIFNYLLDGTVVFVNIMTDAAGYKQVILLARPGAELDDPSVANPGFDKLPLTFAGTTPGSTPLTFAKKAVAECLDNDTKPFLKNFNVFTKGGTFELDAWYCLNLYQAANAIQFA
ncbi:MAG: hypothetical protein FWE85_00470, partial [Clostridiales bacterium]|nr:hypothetical protein [Clostridiales bacterium]